MDPRRSKAVFLDRDGTIIRDVNYLGDPGGIEFLPGAVEALRSLHARGYLLVIITNQSGVARGLFDEAACRAVSQRLVELLACEGVPIASSYCCPHLPGAPVPGYDVVCDCRKPAPGLFRKAIAQLDIDPYGSWAVGDSLRDLAPAKELGAGTVLVRTGKGREQESLAAAGAVVDHAAEDLADAARIITRRG